MILKFIKFMALSIGGIFLIILIVIFGIQFFSNLSGVSKLCKSYSQGSPFNAKEFKNKLKDTQFFYASMGTNRGSVIWFHKLRYIGTLVPDQNHNYFPESIDENQELADKIIEAIDNKSSDGKVHITGEGWGFSKNTCQFSFANGKISTEISLKNWD